MEFILGVGDYIFKKCDCEGKLCDEFYYHRCGCDRDLLFGENDYKRYFGKNNDIPIPVRIKKDYESDFEYNYIDRKGNYLLDRNYYQCNPFNDGVGVVKIDSHEYNYVNKNGKFILGKDCYRCRDFSCGFGVITNNDNSKQTYVNSNGELLVDEWFSSCNDFEYFDDDYYGVVVDDGKCLWAIDKDGNKYHCGCTSAGEHYIRKSEDDIRW